MKANIGNVLLAKLKPTEKTFDIWDTKLTGFILRVYPSGNMVYRCEYARGKRITIGKAAILTPMQARDRAKEILGDAAKGINPAIVKKTEKAVTFRHFIQAEYSPWFKVNRKSTKSLSNLKHFIEAFGDKPLNEINLLLVEKWRIRRLEKNISVSTVNRNIVALKAALSKASEWGIVDNNLLQKLKLSRVDNISKVRYLSREEENQLRQALDQREQKLTIARDKANLWRRARGYPEKPFLANLTFADYIKPMSIDFFKYRSS